MPQPPRQEQQPISAMDFLRGTPGQFRAHKQLPVEPEPVRKRRLPKRIRKLVWAIFAARRDSGGAEPDDPEADAAMRAWLERAKWGLGPA